MSVKQSLEDNKDAILESLPTQELKDQFLASLDNVEDDTPPTVEEQIAEAQDPDHISDEMYEAVKNEIENMPTVAPMSEAEEKAAIEEALKNPPTPEAPAEDS